MDKACIVISAHLVDRLVVEVLYAPEVRLDQLDVVRLGEEADSPRMVKSVEGRG